MGSIIVVTGPDPELCGRVRALVAADGVVVLDVRGLTEPDPATVDALLRLALAARRLDGRIRLRNVSVRLRDLLTGTGLGAVLDLEVQDRPSRRRPRPRRTGPGRRP
ncbi:STAS domain-containing protein [Pseudonocardia asaccharolytica]|uniref:STAS domain-containing protein n=1 Tax=Pseudonocardia asaccharolytica DSM 44247 = NBRC 16224 TaxID=1123024 RepID=A0A511D380_9PSEU|nr:STAS domain-containing protein [Pseudonocardia asaccharolytica]GEL19242.1 hypothetical protein PA7_30790 [Pseudonocardia asaccharolytica DSM 44247 = NBRC 16224]